jgi:hypothetical protein
MKYSPFYSIFPYMLDHLEAFLYTRRKKNTIRLSCLMFIVNCVLLQTMSDFGLAAQTLVEKL